MEAIRLPNGNLLAPYRAETDGTIGDGMIEIGPDHPDFESWSRHVAELEPAAAPASGLETVAEARGRLGKGEFVEQKHPRDDKGEFAPKGEGAGGAAESNPNEDSKKISTRKTAFKDKNKDLIESYKNTRKSVTHIRNTVFSQNDLDKIDKANTDLQSLFKNYTKEVLLYPELKDTESKANIVLDISKNTGIDHKIVDRFLEAWAETSNFSKQSICNQMAIEKELKSPISKYQKDNLDYLVPSAQEREDGISKAIPLVKQVYANTQNMFKAMGFKPDDTIFVYRGMATPVRDLNAVGGLVYHGNSSESWTFKKDIADGFGNRTYVSRVKIKDIYSTAYTGIGVMREGEVVVLDNANRNVFLSKRKFK